MLSFTDDEWVSLERPFSRTCALVVAYACKHQHPFVVLYLVVYALIITQTKSCFICVLSVRLTNWLATLEDQLRVFDTRRGLVSSTLTVEELLCWHQSMKRSDSEGKEVSATHHMKASSPVFICLDEVTDLLVTWKDQGHCFQDSKGLRFSSNTNHQRIAAPG